MEELAKLHFDRMKAVHVAINRYQKQRALPTFRHIIVLCYFCLHKFANNEQAFTGLEDSMDKNEFNAIIQHLLEHKLIERINKRGRFVVYAPTEIAIKLHKVMIYT